MFVWLAAANADVEKVAWPPAIVPVPSVVAPSLKLTVPVGVPVPGETGLMVAVKTTAWPNTVGLVEEVRVVVLLNGLTTWLKAGVLVLVLKLVSPLYTAVIEWVATDKVELLKVAWPPLSVWVASVLVP